MDWPANPFWDYALELYRWEGVERACLDLQRRHGLDVNLVLLCCWLAARGVDADEAWLQAATAAVERWQIEVIHPLRAVRTGLKAELAEPPPGSIAAHWPDLMARLRQRVLSLEIDGERLEQLLLAELAAELPASAAPGSDLAIRNLSRYHRFDREDRRSLEVLIGAAFPEGAAEAIAAHLGGLGG